MVGDADSHEFPDSAQATSQFLVLDAGLGVPGRVVVDHDQCHGGLADRDPEDLPGVDQRSCERPLRDEMFPDHAVPGVEEHDPELLAP